ncbi:hypothetical protein BGZ88_005969 [Linnemannia elongata]|nr:hypothetical protein BGZ88_005969 [Linnemannia elongata]
MNKKIDFATIRAQIPREWPRYSVGLLAVVGLRNGLTLLWTTRIWAPTLDGLDPDSLATLNEAGVNPTTVLLIKQGLIGGLASYILYANSMALKGALRRNPRNIRTAFKMWLIPQVLIQAPTVLACMFCGWELTDRQIVEYLGHLVMTAVDGWSMFVYMRDLKGQKRNSYGFLLEDDGETEAEKGAVCKRTPLEEQV